MPEHDDVVIQVSGWETFKEASFWFGVVSGFFGFLAFLSGLLS